MIFLKAFSLYTVISVILIILAASITGLYIRVLIAKIKEPHNH